MSRTNGQIARIDSELNRATRFFWLVLLFVGSMLTAANMMSGCR
jgi:hypothetical protein